MVNSKVYNVILTQELFDKYFEDVDFTCDEYLKAAVAQSEKYQDMRLVVEDNLFNLTDEELSEILESQVQTK